MAEDLTLSDFRAMFPEFSKAPSDAVVELYIDQAHLLLDKGVWGDKRSTPAGYLVAHYCSLQPRGREMRLDKNKEGAETWYYREYEKLLRVFVGGPRLVSTNSERTDVWNKIKP